MTSTAAHFSRLQEALQQCLLIGAQSVVGVPWPSLLAAPKESMFSASTRRAQWPQSPEPAQPATSAGKREVNSHTSG